MKKSTLLCSIAAVTNATKQVKSCLQQLQNNSTPRILKLEYITCIFE